MTSNLSFVPAAATKVDKLILTPEFSRLPPDGHEFPPNFQELNGNFSNGGEKMISRWVYLIRDFLILETFRPDEAFFERETFI
jgi:hypothetical protein